MVWYYAEGSQQRGPISDAELDEMIARGTVSGKTLVWQDGMENWQSLETVRTIDVSPPPPIVQLGAPSEPSNSPATQTSAFAGLESCQNCGRNLPAHVLRRLANLRICQDCMPAVAQAVQQVAPTPLGTAAAPTQVRYAGFWIRSVAKSVDHFLIGLLLTPITARMMPADLPDKVMALLMRASGDPEAILRQAQQFEAAFFPYFISVLVLYNAIFVALLSATPGKMLCGLKVVSADMTRVSFAQAIARAVIPGLLWIGDEFGQVTIGKLIILVGYLMVAFDVEKRSLFDRICRTRVIRK